MTTQESRRAVRLFLVLLVAFSSPFYAFVYLSPDAGKRWLSYSAAFMWCPGVAALHATSNALQGAFETLTKHGDVTSYFTYEYGVGFAIVVPLMAVPFWKKLRGMEPQGSAS